MDTPAELDPSQAQDTLNTNIQPGGASIFKRDGYGLFQTLNVSTAAVHGGYHFQQTGGSDVQLWGNDNYLNASVSDATFVKIATGTVNATWQCADSQGFAYCLDSSRDTAVKTDGSSVNTSYQTGIPLGTMLTFTPTQLVVAGVSGNESTIYVSQQNSFITFTVGTLPSSAFTEPIASPGSRITHLAYYFGKLFWWKDQSFGYATFTNQNDWQLTIVSNQIGTLDNSDAFWNSSGFDSGTKFSGIASANANRSPGGIFFRGQDNHMYVYDGYYLTRLSRVITPTVTSANRRKTNSWTQTSQSDFNGGVAVPFLSVSTTIVSGSVVSSSFSTTEASSTSWNLGSANTLTIGVSSISLPTNNGGTVTDPGFETNPITTNWSVNISGVGTDSITSVASVSSNGCGSIIPDAGSRFAQFSSIPANGSYSFQLIDVNSNVLAQTAVAMTPLKCTYSNNSISSVGNLGKRFFLRIIDSNGSSVITKDSYILGADVTFRFAGDTNTGSTGYVLAVDNIQNGSSTITTGSFISQTFDSHFASATYTLQSNFNANTSTPSFALLTATGIPTNNWVTTLTSTGTNAIGNRYSRYTSTISIGSADNALTSISTFTVIAESSGSYRSTVNSASNITGWSTLSENDNYVGNSSITYYYRASNTTFNPADISTPVWVSVMKNGVPSGIVAPFFQLRGDFYLTAATETAQLNDFTFNWFEGLATDKAYMTYFNDAIWFSVSTSSSISTNNRIFYWDLLNGAWLIYDIPSNGFLIENNRLYLGDPTAGKVYLFGSVTTDNGANINSYWRSKSFLGVDPFVQNEFVQSDFVLGQSSTTLTYTYTLDSKTATSYTMTAYDSAASLIQRNFLLPVGKIGKYYDFKIGDNSSAQAWRLMAHRVKFNSLNWKPVLN